MSRPNTRNKNKRQKSDDGDDSSIDILRKIHLTGEVSQADVRQLYLLWKPICQGCRGNSKDSPNCFCGFIPQSSGTRKAGLWQKMSDIIQSLGPNPYKDLRSSTDTPAGLTNLGATCYANSILQCLYMNTSFRKGIFSVEPDLLKQHAVLDQLARLFVQLHSSKMAFIDSAPFIKSLELDNGVQQDSHEFLTLFLSLLERSLSHSKISGAKTVVQDLFSGSVSHVTKCSVCGKDSEASSKMEDFYELELNIKGLNNLHESLDDYLSVEKLDGENQYFCESCGGRVDATRNIKLQTLPSVLNFQLKRYVFLPKTTTKKKITDSFSFPRRLNMAKRLCHPSESALMYELSAILIHKGQGANSGHYVAHIKDEYSGQWWEFDDEHVSKLGIHPFGKVSATAKVEQNGSERVSSVANGHHTVSRKEPTIANSTSNEEEVFSSTDAYMLMYTCVNIKKDTRRSNGTSSEVADMEIDVDDNSLPFHLKREIQELNASYDRDCEEYQKSKDKQLSCVNERREEVKSILSEAPVQSPDDPYFWITTDWLRQWTDNITPPCIDNTPILCLHGKVSFSKVSSMKRLSDAAWHMLLSKYGGGPALTNDDYCLECLKDAARSAVCADDYRDRRGSLRPLAEAAVTGNCPDGNSYLVSKSWLVQWLRRKNADNPCDADAGPTESLKCPHGDLLPEIASGAKRVSIPEILWLFLFESANKVKPDDLVLAFPSDSRPCETCTLGLSEVASFEDNLRAAKLKQRQNHEKLILGKSLTLSAGLKYFVVPSSWLAKWRTFTNATGKNKFSVEPENLQVIVDSLICEKHSRLLERPPELVWKRGTITQKSSATEGLTLISEGDWKFFCEEWKAVEDKGIHAEISFSNSSTIKLNGASEEKEILVEGVDNFNEEASKELESRRPFLRTFPEVCDDCIGERESCELVQKLNYCNENICVYLVRGKEAPRSIIEASGSVSESDRRMSKRSRKSSFGNSVNLRVSGSTSIYQLKMMIWEKFGIVKENQKLHKGSTEIQGDSANLADKNIFPGDLLWVKDTEIHENRDIADELSEQKMEPQEVEEGFRGTLLSSDVSLQLFQEPPFN